MNIVNNIGALPTQCRVDSFGENADISAVNTSRNTSWLMILLPRLPVACKKEVDIKEAIQSLHMKA